MSDAKKPRKSLKKKLVETIQHIPCYLAIPKDENDWIRYLGRCDIFAGKFIKDDMWIMEPEDETISKLANALEKAGIKCETITFELEDIKDGVRHCNVICYYNKPYEPYNDDFYLSGLTTFDFIYLEKDPSEYQLEFSLCKVL